jgi:hypothetical protein|tara:strand:+ start:2351 stop:2686 length:336 start_codon:yes stop_codon:yes gene_type:complete
MAQEPHKPTDKTREQAKQAAGLGLPHDQIGALLGVSHVTLRKYYETELALGKATASAQIAKTLFNKAQSGDTTALIWWTKAQMRWAETQRHENTGPEGGPQELTIRWADPK